MSNTELVSIVDRQFAAYNRCDLESFVACYAPDAKLYDLPNTTPVAEGHEQIRERYRPRFENKNLHAEITKRMFLGNFLIDYENIKGIPGIDLLEAIVVYQVVDGLIDKVWFIRKD